MRIGFGLLRATMALLGLAAVVAQFATSVGAVSAQGGSVPGLVANFFSFFTIESNLAAIVVLAIGAVLLLARTGDDPGWFTVTRATVTTYMVTTGVVYNLLLRGIPLPQGQTVPWSNEVLHVVAPAYLLLDWLLAPGRAPLRRRSLGIVVVFPIVWALYTLVRAPLAADPVSGRQPWYPYPFLNPHTSPNGYLSVAFYILLIAAVILCVGYGVLWVSRKWRGGRPLPADAA